MINNIFALFPIQIRYVAFILLLLLLLSWFFLMLSCKYCNSPCISLRYNVTLEHLFVYQGGEGLAQFTLDLGCLCQTQRCRICNLAYSTQFLIRMRLLTENVVLIATSIFGKSPYRSEYTELRKSKTFLEILFQFLINFSCNFGCNIFSL